MSDIDMLFWQAPTDGVRALKRAIELSEAAIQAAERGDEAEARTRLEAAEREAAELERPAVKPMDPAALAAEVFRVLAPTAVSAFTFEAAQVKREVFRRLTANPIDLAALAREAFRRLAPTAAEREEPLDADQYEVDRRICRRVNRELARYNLRSFSRAPTAAEKRLFARPGYLVYQVEVQFDHGLWLRLPRYQRDCYNGRHNVRRLEHLHAVDTRIGLNWPTA